MSRTSTSHDEHAIRFTVATVSSQAAHPALKISTFRFVLIACTSTQESTPCTKIQGQEHSNWQRSLVRQVSSEYTVGSAATLPAVRASNTRRRHSHGGGSNTNIAGLLMTDCSLCGAVAFEELFDVKSRIATAT